jgi:hypothetical protein
MEGVDPDALKDGAGPIRTRRVPAAEAVGQPVVDLLRTSWF